MALTKLQEKAAKSLGNNLIVSSGAGTGKTSVLIERVLHLIQTRKASMTELLVLTFTEKAANEIKSRLSEQFKNLGMETPRRDLERSAISTFHSFASSLLRKYPIEAGVDPFFRVMENEQTDLLKEEALAETVKASYQKGDGTFELFHIYGEENLKHAILKVFMAARHEGKNLKVFFEKNTEKLGQICKKKEREIFSSAVRLAETLGEDLDSREWEKFFRKEKWGWNTFRQFRDWQAPYQRGGKKTLQEEWKAWRELMRDFASLKAETLAVPWREKFELLALCFEAFYESQKREKSLLDFDDLQTRTVNLFKSPKEYAQRLKERCRQQFRFILVDEFQDTNFLQVDFLELLTTGKNLFMVGDYKQSIYGFRGAEPDIFLEKEKLYQNPEHGERLVLTENFRSEPPVIDFINAFFSRLWEEDRFPYEPLTAQKGTSGKKNNGSIPAVEVLATLLREDEEKEHAQMREASALALRIKRLYDEEHIPYGDMAVLFQAMTVSGIYEEAFKTAGIPYFVVAGRGFYEQPEVQDMINFLSHLEKPLLDIPLAACLRSPFFHISDDTLFWLSRYAKKKTEKAPLYQALKEWDRIPEITEEERKRLGFFWRLTQELQVFKDRFSLAELMDAILERTGYELSALADPAGVRRYANLKKLIAIAREYEAYERVPLHIFLRTLKHLELQEVRESEAQVAREEGGSAVRLMSVHAAKGLEFPVVFIANMDHARGRSESKAVVAHAAYGYDLRVMNPETQKEEKPYFYNQIDQAIRAREKQEKKRLFYVAVTRAQARLFFSGVFKEDQKNNKKFPEIGSWMEWAMSIAGEMGLKVDIDPQPDLILGTPPETALGASFSAYFEKAAAEIKTAPQTVPELPCPKAVMPLPRSIDLPVSAYVLFRKDPALFWRTYQIGWTVGVPEPVWNYANVSEDEEERLSASDFGTLMHAVLEGCDFKDPESVAFKEFFEKTIKNLNRSEQLYARQLFQRFIRSALFRKLQKARQIHREIDFVLNGRHGLIHGKLDLLFEDAKGAWHILDYKTAVGDAASVDQKAYDLQIKIYALAAYQVLNIPVHSGILYFLKNQKTVILPFHIEKAERAFADIEKEVFDLQKKILDYSNERIMKAHDGFKSE